MTGGENTRDFVKMEIEETLAIIGFKTLKSALSYRKTVQVPVAVKT